MLKIVPVENKMQIAGMQKSSLIDYPSKIAAVIFTLGCNFRCPYCHNPNILTAVSSNKLFDESAVFDFLKSRRGKLDAVVVSGGEPTLQKDLINFFEKIKQLGFLTKLDTNGTSPQILKQLKVQGLVDYIAMDIKAPIDKYSQVTCVNVETKKIEQSIEFLKSSGIEYEFRTTTVASQLSISDFETIGKMLEGSKTYYLQKFKPDVTLNPQFADKTTYNNEEFSTIKTMLLKYIDNVYVR